MFPLSVEPMHDNGTQTIKAEVVEPIVEAQETCREEANTSSSYSPSPRTVYTCNDGKVGRRDVFYYQPPQQHLACWRFHCEKMWFRQCPLLTRCLYVGLFVDRF